MQAQKFVVNDVTKLNPVMVREVIVPETVKAVQAAIKNSSGPVSIGGGRFSMGGQTASPDSLHMDMRKLNKVISFSKEEKKIRVQAGIRWRDIQEHVDPHDLSIKIMQTYSNFTVGGALSVNAHGRYIGLGPLILSVREISVVLVDGTLVKASPQENQEIFYGVIGGYGGLGVIVEAELDLAENVQVERVSKRMPISQYLEYFRKNVRDSKQVIFHNADIYPPHYSRINSVSWAQTDKPVTEKNRLIPTGKSYKEWQYFMWAITETPFGRWRREHIVDPLLFSGSKVHWRNYEASYDVAELEPPSREEKTYVLQEYFVPIDRFDEFVPKIAEILQRHHVNVVNISIRHALSDGGSYMAWARKEVFAFVLYYKQRINDNAKNRVAVWTRELVDAVLSVEGTYYLPYQAHPTQEQFHRAYPRAKELFELKKKFDPDFRLRNVIWDTYYKPWVAPKNSRAVLGSEFHAVFSDTFFHDGFYRFLQVVYNLYPEDRFHMLIKDACSTHSTDKEIYQYIQNKLPTIKPFLSELTYALPALMTQKKEMTRQTLALLGDKKHINGCLEIGSTGRYVSDLKKHITIEGPIVCVHDFAPTNSPIDIVERGQLKKLGAFSPLNNYQPLNGDLIKDSSFDLVTCFIGLHHSPPENLDGFVRSIWKALRPGEIFILRDHDVKTPEMHTFVSLVHTVFNAGINVDWETNQKELRHFNSIDHWSKYLEDRGFRNIGQRLLQANDPSDNTLMAFVKEDAV